MGFKKKLYPFRPDREKRTIETFRTHRKCRREECDPQSLERGVRQLLANKVSGNMVGLWFLVAEHLRLGTWDLLCSWSGAGGDEVQPRLALQMVHEAALCVKGLRYSRSLSQRGFEVLNGLPFVASDQAIHELLDSHTVEQAMNLQVQLGILRRARGHFQGKLLALDPHRLHSSSKRQMVRYRSDQKTKPYKVVQTYFCLDVDTAQPVCFTSQTSAMTVTQALPELLTLSAAILNTKPRECLVLADTEHASKGIIDYVVEDTPYDLMIPLRQGTLKEKEYVQKHADRFVSRWSGYATTKFPYAMKNARTGPHCAIIQRDGERPEAYHAKAFLCTADRPEVDDLSINFPKRWHIEEFFNTNQALGWGHAGTMNLNIRYGQMSLALIAQAACHQFRQRLGQPYASWDAKHMAESLFRGIDGDIRVTEDTIVVTCYNAPTSELFRSRYEGLPEQLKSEGADSRIPWLYGYKLDFKFK